MGESPVEDDVIKLKIYSILGSNKEKSAILAYPIDDLLNAEKWVAQEASSFSCLQREIEAIKQHIASREPTR